jgi:hypothetical protein
MALTVVHVLASTRAGYIPIEFDRARKSYFEPGVPGDEATFVPRWTELADIVPPAAQHYTWAAYRERVTDVLENIVRDATPATVPT